MEEEIIPKDVTPVIVDEVKEELVEDARIRLGDSIIPENSILVVKIMSDFFLYDFGNSEPLLVRDVRYDDVSGYIAFDKNTNHIVTTYNRERKNNEKDKYPTVSKTFCFAAEDEDSVDIHSLRSFKEHMTIDKNTLFESKGTEIKVLTRSVLTKKDIDRVKDGIKSDFILLEESIKRLKDVVSSIYPEEDYDIYTCYIFNNNSEAKTTFISTIHVIERDITITNSIEQEHFIGDMLVSLGVKINQNLIHVIQKLEGMRLTHSVIDLSLGYQHSHLPRMSINNTPYRGTEIAITSHSFCLGSENHMFRFMEKNSRASITELDLEGILFSIHDYVRWESLEGGPHIRMESLSAKGSLIPVDRKMIDPTGYASHKLEIMLNVFRKHSDLVKTCFKLINRNGSLEFILNEKKLNSLFMSDELREDVNAIIAIYPEAAVLYDPERETFHKQSNKTWDQIQKESETSVNSSPRPYINGRYVDQKLLINEEEKQKYNDLKKFISPIDLFLIARTYLYQLNKELENEYKRRQKEILSGD